MKLQIKNNGAWRDIGHFFPEQERGVLLASTSLLRALAAQKTSMRTTDERGAVILYCNAPVYGWVLA